MVILRHETSPIRAGLHSQFAPHRLPFILMQNNNFDPVARERTRDRELRAAVDVMFEALSHIQASLEASSEEKRVQSYRTFKEALYERFEYLVDEYEDEDRAGAVLQERADAGAESEDEEDTLEKLWPDIAVSEG